MNIIAFDIGIRNLAFSMVHFNKHESKMNDIKEYIKSIMNIKYIDNFDSIFENDSHYIDYYKNTFTYLKTLNKIWEQTNIILIEKQLTTYKFLNIQSLKMSQHIMAFFLLNYPQIKIIEYPASCKTKILFNQSISLKKDRKLWAINQIYWFLDNDPIALDWFNCFKKKDDISDSILMCITYFYTHYINIK